MFELLKFANENNVNVNIKVMDGSYRPLVGEAINIITFSVIRNKVVITHINIKLIAFSLNAQIGKNS